MNKQILLILLLQVYCAQAMTFDPIVVYATTLPELIHVDNDDWQRPDFSSRYGKEKEEQYFSFLYNLGFTSKQITSSDFARLIEHLNSVAVTQDGADGMTKLTLPVNAQCVIFGDLQGAFHSLLRDIRQLISMGILSEDLTLVDDAYIVFNGNVIGDTPYNMQTLYIVFQLMMHNPDKVIYIKGINEQHWLTSKSQLYQQLSMLQVGNNVLASVSTFFNGLPSRLYMTHNDQKDILIDGRTTPYQDDQTQIAASIIAHHEHKTIGLRRYMGPPTNWSLFSSPTDVNRRLHAFLYDAFALIRVQPEIENWTITFYHTDARTQKGFPEPSTYNLIIGNWLYGPVLTLYDTADIARLKQEVDYLEERVKELTELCLLQEKKQAEHINADQKLLAIHDNVILFGCTLDMVRSIRNQSESLQEGLLAKIKIINESGGLQGKQIQIVFLDDAYTPSKARENIARFIKEFKTDLLLCPIGTPTLEYYLDLVKSGNLLVLFPITGSLLFKNVDYENIIQFRPSYVDELGALTEYVIAKYQAKKFLIFYQKDSYGQMHKEAIKTFLDSRGIQQYQEFSYERNELNFTSRIHEIQAFNPDTIIFISTATAAQSLIRQMGAGYFVDKYLYGTSNNFGEAAFKNFMKLKGLNFFVANVVPNPEMSDIAIAQEFRNRAKQSNITIDTISFEGYIMASLMEYIFTHVDGLLSKESIVASARNIKDLNFKGLRLDYDTSFYRLSNKVWISESHDPNWIEVDLQRGGNAAQE